MLMFGGGRIIAGIQMGNDHTSCDEKTFFNIVPVFHTLLRTEFEKHNKNIMPRQVRTALGLP